VRVRVLNPINAAASQEVANRVLGAAALTKPAANRWTASIGTGGTATAPIPRAGIWRFQVALVSRGGVEGGGGPGWRVAGCACI